MLSETDLRKIKTIVYQLKIPLDYKKCIIYGVRKIYDLMPYKPVFIGLCGSAAREDIIPQFSDIDLLFIHQGETTYDITKRYKYKGIKIGLTILPDNLSAPQYLDRKPWYFFRCFQKGLYKELYGNNKIIPAVGINKLYEVTAGEVNLNFLKQLISTELKNDFLNKSIKHCHTLMKNIVFLETREEVEGYKNVYERFYVLFEKRFVKIPTIEDILHGKFENNDIKEKIKEFLIDSNLYLTEE